MKQQRWTLVLCLLLVPAFLLTACGRGTAKENVTSTASNTTDDSTKNVTLRVFMTNVVPNIQELSEKFVKQYPNIKVDVDTTPIDQYDSLLNTKLASGDAPDVFLVYGGKKMERLVKAGHLMDLSDQPWVERLLSGAKLAASHDGKVYALPGSQYVIGVIYNKKIFEDLGLSIPQNWEEFLNTAQAIKNAGIIPLGLGMKDVFTSQFIPYAMAPSAIYRDHPDFDAQMAEGTATFLNSPWKQMLEDYVDLDKRGLFNTGVLGTSFDQVQQLVASNKIAMMVALSPTLTSIRALNPDNEYGMFPLPYVKEGEKIWVSSNTQLIASIYTQTKYPEEAKLYLEFLAQPENMKVLMENNLSGFKDIASEVDPAVAEIEPYLVNGSYPFLDSVWPTTVQPTLFTGVQNLFAGESVDKVLEELDKAYRNGLNQ